MESSQCLANDGNVDRISAFPDPLIIHILSFLPFKDSAATSILSKRWRSLFAFLPDVDLDFCPTDSPDKERSVIECSDRRRLLEFLNFSSRMLQLRDGAPIRNLTFSLRWMDETFLPLVNQFISAALGFDVRELHIYIASKEEEEEEEEAEEEAEREGEGEGEGEEEEAEEEGEGEGEEDEEDSQFCAISCPEIFTCKSLGSVELMVESEFPSSVFLPNLKKLEMRITGQVNVSVQKLIQGCPVLEELDLCFDDKAFGAVEFSSPSIKKLRILFFGGECTTIVDSDVLEHFTYSASHHRAIINAPNLRTLSYYGPANGVIFTRHLNSLVEATMGFGWSEKLSSYDAIDHLVRVQRVKSLAIGQHILEALNDSQASLPTFKNLTHLELLHGYPDDIDCTLSWRTLPSLLEKTPNLQFLVLNEVTFGNLLGKEEFESLLLEALPLCFITRLEGIEIRQLNMEEEEYQFKLIEYLLQNGKGLKKVILGLFLPPSLCEKISSFKRGSQHCEIVLEIKGRKPYGMNCDDPE